MGHSGIACLWFCENLGMKLKPFKIEREHIFANRKTVSQLALFRKISAKLLLRLSPLLSLPQFFFPAWERKTSFHLCRLQILRQEQPPSKRRCSSTQDPPISARSSGHRSHFCVCFVTFKLSTRTEKLISEG